MFVQHTELDNKVSNWCECCDVPDEGMIVPSVTSSLRDQLFLFAQDADFTFPRLAETVGRAVVEVAIPLLGGPHR